MTQFGIVHLSSETIDTYSSFGALLSALYADLTTSPAPSCRSIGR
jgi:hypothetical protein